jgi:tRNA(Ile)-lysidine synthase
MLSGGERVVVAVSGGADSTALLWALARLADDWRLALHGVHVHHGLRPDADRDADAACALGARLGIPVDVVRVQVDRRGSLQAAAREARYAALHAYADRLGAPRIAVGHTADDQAETVLLRLLEGTGLRGLAGIPPVRGRIIRPLLEIRRARLRQALREVGLGWVEDPTNTDLRFARNRIRHVVLPALAAGWPGGDLVERLLEVARRARAVVDRVEAMAQAELARAVLAPDGALLLARRRLRTLPGAVAFEVLRQAMRRAGVPCLRAWAYRALARLLADPCPPRPLRVGSALLEASDLVIRVAAAPTRPLVPRDLAVPGSVPLPELGLVLEARRLSAAGYAIPRDPWCVAFDAERLPGALRVRGRRPGDRFQPFGAPRASRLKRLLANARLPRWERARWPLVEAGGTLVWIAGLRRGAVAPVDGASREVVELRLRPLEAS